MRVCTVLGTRPQLIKASVVSTALAGRGVEELVIDTGQHYDDDMAGVFFAELGLPVPFAQLGVATAGHGVMTGRMMEALDPLLDRAKPDAVLVYGDTNSTLAGALVGAKQNLPVVHVEAGLRSFDRRMPEEVNRVVTDHVSTLLFAPTHVAVANLGAEGVDDATVVLSGDVMFDVALRFGAVARDDVLDRVGVRGRDYVLATIHRAATVDDAAVLASVIEALAAVAADVAVVLPLHPRTRKALAALDVPGVASVTVINPVGYLEMAALERSARLVVTDSGGVQKEAFFHRVPCVTVRTETEWTELVDLGWNRLAPPGDASIVEKAIRAALDAGPGLDGAPYGDGRAADVIARTLVERLG